MTWTNETLSCSTCGFINLMSVFELQAEVCAWTPTCGVLLEWRNGGSCTPAQHWYLPTTGIQWNGDLPLSKLQVSRAQQYCRLMGGVQWRHSLPHTADFHLHHNGCWLHANCKVSELQHRQASKSIRREVNISCLTGKWQKAIVRQHEDELKFYEMQLLLYLNNMPAAAGGRLCTSN